MPSSNNNSKSLLNTSKILYSNSKTSIKNLNKRIKRKFPQYVKSLLPISSWLKNYQLEWLLGDMVAGLTVGIMLVPQALAYSKLTGLSSEYALYSSLIGGIIYSFLGTCREISIGPTAISSLIIGQYIQDIKNQTDSNGSEIAGIFCILCALISLFLGFFRLGFLLELVSNPVIMGFTTGAACKAILTQLPGLLGIPNVNTNQLTHLIIINIINNLININWVNLVFGLSSTLFLLTLNFISFKLRKYIIIQYLSIGIIGIAVVIFTIIAYIVKINYPDLKINLVGDIPSGIKFTLPSSDLNLWLKIFPLAIPLTFILLIELLAMVKTFSKAGGYSINTSQEMVALGMANLVGTFFSSYPVSGALSRCVVLSKTGVKSPLSGIFTGIVVILAVMVLTPAFKYIPLPTLAAIIVVAVCKLVMGWSELLDLFLIDKLDFYLCILCIIFAFLLGSDLGIYISVGLSFFLLVIKIAHPKVSILYKVIGDVDIYEDRKNNYFESENPIPGVIIFRPKESLIFPNIEHFKEAMMNVILEETASLAAPIPAKDKPWSDDLLSKGERLRIMRSKETCSSKIDYHSLPPLKGVIMDMTCVNIIDGSGIQGLRDFKEQCEKHSGLTNTKDKICQKSELNNNTSIDDTEFKMLFVTTSSSLITKLKNSSIISSNQGKDIQEAGTNISSIDCYYTIEYALNQFN